MNDELDGIDYVIYLHNTDNMLHVTDLTDRTITTESTGEPWYKDAYGNCLIALQYAKTTEKLYLITKDILKQLRIKDNEYNVKLLEQYSSRIVTG